MEGRALSGKKPHRPGCLPLPAAGGWFGCVSGWLSHAGDAGHGGVLGAGQGHGRAFVGYGRCRVAFDGLAVAVDGLAQLPRVLQLVSEVVECSRTVGLNSQCDAEESEGL